MGQLDPRFGPTTQNRTVTVEYLDELYGKADELRLLKRYLETLQIDIGGFDTWRSRQHPTFSSAGSSATGSTHGSARSELDAERVTDTTNRRQRRHATIF